ncbi:hypothetical protein [Streptomyces sp. NPDC018000]|uniref:hypothetical protein n=1 Tax=Streptomyces sp. NPDC018000 TaxID=3365028 RepID=UPI0037A2934A
MHTRILITAALLAAVIQPSPAPSTSAPATGTPSTDATRPGSSLTAAAKPQGRVRPSPRSQPHSTRALTQSSLTITVPTIANLGAASAGSSHSSQLGTVTVTGSDISDWNVTVTATALTTVGGTISASGIAYWSGPVTGTGSGNCHPGQVAASNQVTLNAPRTAFSHTGAANESCSWNPTLVITVPTTAPAGQYTGTITHSVA